MGRRRQIAIAISFCWLGAFVLLSFQNCAKNLEQVNGGPTLVSPFERQRVILDDVRSEATRASMKVVDGKRQPAYDKVVILVDTTCVKSWCQRGYPEALACQVTANSESNSTNDAEAGSRAPAKQAFEFHPKEPLTETEFSDWVESSPVDRECIKGISHWRELTSTQAPPFNDPEYSKQYFHSNIKTAETLDFFGSGLDPVKVAVIDSGIDINHIDLQGNFHIDQATNAPYNVGYDVGSNDYNHATVIAGIINAKRNNNQGVAGIAPNAQLMSLRVVDGNRKIVNAHLINAIGKAVADGAEVLNLSLGGRGDDPLVKDALIDAVRNNVVAIVAAGNEYLDIRYHQYFPAMYAPEIPGVISVAWGSQKNGLVVPNVDFPNAGSNYSPNHVEIVAPGNNIYSTIPGSSYGGGSGSSYAVPMVTAAMALEIGYLKAHGYRLAPHLLEEIFLKGSEKRSELLNSIVDGNVLNLQNLKSQILSFIASDNLANKVEMKAFSLRSVGSMSYVDFEIGLSNVVVTPDLKLGFFDGTVSADMMIPLEGGVTPVVNNTTMTIKLSVDSNQVRITKMLVFALYREKRDASGAIMKDSSGRPILETVSLYKVPIEDLQVGNPDDAPIRGVVSGITADDFANEGSGFRVFGWTCIEKFPISMKVELVEVGTEKVVAYDYARWEAGGDFFNICNSPSVFHGFQMLAINVDSTKRFYVRSSDPRNPLHNAKLPYQKTSQVEFNGPVNEGRTHLKVTKVRRFSAPGTDQYGLEVEGWACFEKNPAPALVSIFLDVNWLQDYFLKSYPLKLKEQEEHQWASRTASKDYQVAGDLLMNQFPNPREFFNLSEGDRFNSHTKAYRGYKAADGKWVRVLVDDIMFMRYDPVLNYITQPRFIASQMTNSAVDTGLDRRCEHAKKKGFRIVIDDVQKIFPDFHVTAGADYWVEEASKVQLPSFPTLQEIFDKVPLQIIAESPYALQSKDDKMRVARIHLFDGTTAQDLGACPTGYFRDVADCNNMNAVYKCSCAAFAYEPSTSWVYGSNPYTRYSNICDSAYHAGAITRAGGAVTFKVGFGPKVFYGSRGGRNNGQRAQDERSGGDCGYYVY